MDKNTIPHVNREAEEEARRNVADAIRKQTAEVHRLAGIAADYGLTVHIEIFARSHELRAAQPPAVIEVYKINAY